MAEARGEDRLVSLDSSGRVLRYAKTKREPMFDICHGGSWAAEVDVGWDAKNMRLHIGVGRRDLATMKLQDEQRLEGFEREGDGQRYIHDVWCRSRDATDVYVLARRPDEQPPGMLVRLHGGRVDVVIEDAIDAVAFAPIRSVAYVATGDRDSGYAIDEVDLVTSRRRRLLAMKGPVTGLTVDPSGKRIAGAEHVYEGPKVALFTFDLGSHEIHRSRRPRTNPVWVGQRLAAPHHTGRGLHIHDERAKLVVSKPGWKGPAVALGDRLYGAWGGKLRRTEARPGPISVVSDVGLTLDRLDIVPVVEVDRTPRLTWTVLGLLAFAVALAAIVVRSRRRASTEPSAPPEALS